MYLYCHSPKLEAAVQYNNFGPFMTSNHKSEVLIKENIKSIVLRVEDRNLSRTHSDREMQKHTPLAIPLWELPLGHHLPTSLDRGLTGRLGSTRFHFIPPLIFKGMKTKML